MISNNGILTIQKKILVSTKAIQLRDLSPNAGTFAIVGHAYANLILGNLIRGVGNIYDHNDRVRNSDCSVASNFL